jgi:thiol-disulfide isomerase/thioredoxin
MRTLQLLFVSAFIVTAAATSPPLSNKEIGLMLRSGYTSEGVLAEITTRRVLDMLDPATKKSLLDFGASPQLIGALESGSYAVSSSEVDQAKKREAEVAARRAAQIELDQKFNTLYQARQTQGRAKAAAPAPGGVLLLDSLKQKLVRCHDGTINRADGAELEKKKFVAFYYSAHWCAPCRKFTPQLVEYYNRVASAHPEFEIVFVSSDRSRFGWETYIQETRMPWLAIDYDQLADLAAVKALGGGGIPSLLVVDEASHVIASSYDGDKYLGPQNVLTALDKIFATNATGQIAQTR